MCWRIYYDDGTPFSSDEGALEAAPINGVQAIAERRAGRSYLHVGGDVYGWDGSAWRAATEPRNSWPDDTVILRGRLIDTDAFDAIKLEAVKWLLALA